MSKENIDEELNKWYEMIEDGMINNIPKKTTHTTHRPITSPKLRYFQHEYQQLQLRTQTQGWNIEQYQRYKRIQYKIKEECERIRNANYTERLTTITDSYKDPEKFWSLIKKIKAPQTSQKQYLISNNKKLTEDEEKRGNIQENLGKHL